MVAGDLIEDLDLDALQIRVEELVRVVSVLREENDMLRAEHKLLLEERSQLLKRNELARIKIEAIVARLNDLEHEV